MPVRHRGSEERGRDVAAALLVPLCEPGRVYEADLRGGAETAVGVEEEADGGAGQ